MTEKDVTEKQTTDFDISKLSIRVESLILEGSGSLPDQAKSTNEDSRSIGLHGRK